MWLFLLAYTCSGLAGLIYQVTWTRLLTLYLGHSTAAASSVVAAFLGGLALGAALGGRVSTRLTPRQALMGYAFLEFVVALCALVLPHELSAFTPGLRWAYADYSAGLAFSAIRVASCIVMVLVPATALGATFPFAIRWFASQAANRAWSTSVLYTLNTVGAAAGALIAGFWLIPGLGLTSTTRVATFASGFAACAVLVLASSRSNLNQSRSKSSRDVAPRRHSPKQSPASDGGKAITTSVVVPMLVLTLSGFAGLVHEIAWTRILTLVLGPTIYAFAAALAAVILGAAIGSGLGAMVVARSRDVTTWLSFMLAGAAAATSLTSSIAGGAVPRLVAPGCHGRP